MENFKINLLDHYRKLWFFTLNRFKGDNYKSMREYFAKLLIAELEEFTNLEKSKVLDVGGARGEFCKALNDLRGCDAVNLDSNPKDYIWPNTKIGSADRLPFGDSEFDIVICREVLEHIPREKQQKSVDEIYRVTKPGGFAYLAIPPWYNPHAGHGVKPFHILPFKVAKALRRIIVGNEVRARTLKEAGLYPVTFARMSKMILKSGFYIMATRDAHMRMHILTRIPILREVAVPTAVFIVRKR